MPALLKDKLEVISLLVDKVKSESWKFEYDVDSGARKHLKHLLVDFFPTTKKQRDVKQIGEDVIDSVNACFEKMMQEYKRFVLNI
jgi:hypothetical protein